MKLLLTLAALLLSLGVLTAGEPVIAIQPLGGFDPQLARLVAEHLRAEYGLAVEIHPDKPLPPTALYKPRNRYRADKLLALLESAGSTNKVIGLTHKDISCTKGEVYDWGVFGLGSLGGGPCVVSTFRLRARGADQSLFRQRLTRVAVHEIGHTLGLEHCPDTACEMVDAEGSILSVDQSSGHLCKKCREAIAKTP